MHSLTKILVPIDFSERSLGAVHYAKALAVRFGSEITLLHVLAPPRYEFGTLEAGGSILSELYMNRSAQVAEELDGFQAGELAGLNVRRLVLEGDPARAIVELADKEQTGLIVMPTHGYGPFRRFILGSITAKVLHDADCPVWTGVHLEEAPAGDMALRRILCAIDLGPQSCKTLEWAGCVQKQIGAELTVMHVTSCAEGRDDMEAQVRDEVAKLEQRTGVYAQVLLEPGDPPGTVCTAADRIMADLLVIGRGSAAGVFGRLRTNAYAIIRQSACPVVSV